MAVADKPPLVDDKRCRAGDPLLGMEHPEKVDHPPLHVGNQPILQAKFAQRFMNRQRIVRADSYDLSIPLGDFF